MNTKKEELSTASRTVNLIYVDWRDRMFEPEILAAYADKEKAKRMKESKEKELESQGYELDEDFHVWIEDVKIYE